MLLPLHVEVERDLGINPNPKVIVEHALLIEPNHEVFLVLRVHEGGGDAAHGIGIREKNLTDHSAGSDGWPGGMGNEGVDDWERLFIPTSYHLVRTRGVGV